MSDTLHLLCLTPHDCLLALWEAALRDEGLCPVVRRVSGRAELGAALQKPGGAYDLVLADADLPACPPVTILQALRGARPAVPLIFLARRPSSRRAARALRCGARDWLAADDLPRLGAVARREWASQRRYRALLEAEDWMVVMDSGHRALLDQLAESVVSTTSDGLLLSANAAARDLLGVSLDMLGMVTLPEMLDDPSCWDALCQKALAQGAPAVGRVRLVGEPPSAPMRLTVCPRGGGGAAGFSATLRPLTESATHQAPPNHAMARRVRELAHDINNQLMSLSLNVGLMQEYAGLPTMLERSVSSMVRASALAGELTNELLCLARAADQREAQHA